MGGGQTPTQEIGAFVLIYQEILALKTRSVPLLGRKCQPRFMKTFLGYELLLGKKRVLCPDKTTVRYLRVFGELGMDSVQIPYDPTITARILPRLEKAFLAIKERHGRSGTELRRSFRQVRDRLRKVGKAMMEDGIGERV